MKQIVPLPMPRTELGEGQVRAESPKTPAAPSPVTPGQRAPAGDLSEKSRPRLVAPSLEKGGKELMIAASRPSLREERPSAMPTRPWRREKGGRAGRSGGVGYSAGQGRKAGGRQGV
jgi:hypothetical protein